MRNPESKVVPRADARKLAAEWKAAGKKIVFTNGSFDVLHAGHVSYLTYARNLGDVLMVAINTDDSVRRYKGPKRPIIGEQERALMLSALESVDAVTFFDEDEPATLVGEVIPDVLVKAEDWAHYVSGREIVEKNGGRVVLAPFVKGLSTSELIRRILSAYAEEPQKGAQ